MAPTAPNPHEHWVKRTCGYVPRTPGSMALSLQTTETQGNSSRERGVLSGLMLLQVGAAYPAVMLAELRQALVLLGRGCSGSLPEDVPTSCRIIACSLQAH